jgi:hypothetical protein
VNRVILALLALSCGSMTPTNAGGLCYTDPDCGYRACCLEGGPCWYQADGEVYHCDGPEGSACQEAYEQTIALHCEE